VSTTIRLDAQVIEVFKESGRGWQSRRNAALKEWLATRGDRPLKVEKMSAARKERRKRDRIA
jgi:BrnA antitoxin of type II toxin-antitoxin system